MTGAQSDMLKRRKPSCTAYRNAHAIAMQTQPPNRSAKDHFDQHQPLKQERLCQLRSRRQGGARDVGDNVDLQRVARQVPGAALLYSPGLDQRFSGLGRITG